MVEMKVILTEEATYCRFTVKEDESVACMCCMTHLPIAYMLEKEFRKQHLEDACCVS